MNATDMLALEVGTVFEAGVLMPAVTQEKVVHTVLSSNPELGTMTVVCSYFGIRIGKLLGHRAMDEKMNWTIVYGESK